MTLKKKIKNKKKTIIWVAKRDNTCGMSEMWSGFSWPIFRAQYLSLVYMVLSSWAPRKFENLSVRWGNMNISEGVVVSYISRQTRCTNSYMYLYLSLSALHVSDTWVHHQERRVGAVYRNWYKPVPYVRLIPITMYSSNTSLLMMDSSVRNM